MDEAAPDPLLWGDVRPPARPAEPQPPVAATQPPAAPRPVVVEPATIVEDPLTVWEEPDHLVALRDGTGLGAVDGEADLIDPVGADLLEGPLHDANFNGLNDLYLS